MKEVKSWEIKIVVKLEDNYTPNEARSLMEMATNAMDGLFIDIPGKVQGFYIQKTAYETED